MESRKIGIACFIGGAVGVIIALLVAPMFWWLGLLSGIAAGFLTGSVAYDVSEILKRIPDAYRAAKTITGQAFSGTIKSIRFFFQRKLPRAGKWIIEPRPFMHCSLLLTALPIMAGWILIPNFFQELIRFPIALIILLLGLFMFNLLIIQTFYLCGENLIREKVNKLYNATYFTTDIISNDIICRKEGSTVFFPLTYRFTAQGISFGIFNICVFFLWLLPKYIVIGIGYLFYGIAMGFYFAGKFAWHLFKLIHSEKRVLCGVDSAVGAAISFVCLYQSNLNIGAAILIVACGGILGAALGIVNWELVSKRLLRRYLPHIS